ncbi:MAG: UMP kinase [Thermoprotei archaeon]
MSKLVIKLTGKLFDEVELVKKYVELLKNLLKEYKIAVITGGGYLARKYIEFAKSIGVSSHYWLDYLGIEAARLNGYLLVTALQPYAYPRVATSLHEVIDAFNRYSCVVTGGLIPGQSTAAVAVEVAEAIGAGEVIDLAAVDGVYNKDPRKYSDAKKYSEINASELMKILEQEVLPGEYALIDLRALKLAIRSRIVVKIAYYRDPNNLLKVIKGENPGTIIYPR